MFIGERITLLPAPIEVAFDALRREDEIVECAIVIADSFEECLDHLTFVLEAEPGEAIDDFANADLCIGLERVIVFNNFQEVELRVVLRS